MGSETGFLVGGGDGGGWLVERLKLSVDSGTVSGVGIASGDKKCQIFAYENQTTFCGFPAPRESRVLSINNNNEDVLRRMFSNCIRSRLEIPVLFMQI